jgi:hypothetical protein
MSGGVFDPGRVGPTRRGRCDRSALPNDQAHIGFARCGTAEQHVLLKDKEIFTLPYAKATDPKDPYWNFSYAVKKTE